MSPFALHPVPDLDVLAPSASPDQPPEMPPQPLDELFFDGPLDEEPGWARSTGPHGGLASANAQFAFEADLQFFCRSTALHRTARGYEGVSAARTLLEFARHHGEDEILRWGPSRVSAFLRYGDPMRGRRSMAGREGMLRVLRALVHFAHEEVGVDAAWGMLSLAAIEADADDYLCATAYEPVIHRRPPLEDLRALVGGGDALAALDDSPLTPVDAIPDDVAVPAALRARVEEVLTLTGGFAQAHLGPEFAIACCALVRRLATDAPVALFRRDPTMTAAGIVWLIGRGNGMLQPEDDLCGVDVSTHFDLPRGAYGRMHFLVREVGCGLRGGLLVGLPLVLPDPAMQLASTRRAILRVRDALADHLPSDDE